LYSLYEIVISTNAINVELESFEARNQEKGGGGDSAGQVTG
jgi:hypothetical protein